MSCLMLPFTLLSPVRVPTSPVMCSICWSVFVSVVTESLSAVTFSSVSTCKHTRNGSHGQTTSSQPLIPPSTRMRHHAPSCITCTTGFPVHTAMKLLQPLLYQPLLTTAPSRGFRQLYVCECAVQPHGHMVPNSDARPGNNQHARGHAVSIPAQH